jgi:cytoskeletal protein CcmA (bactofilin family)
MFKSKEKNTKNQDLNQGSYNLIGPGTLIKGDITSKGDIRIEGCLNGTIILKAKLVIGQTGTVEGNIEAQNADVSGTINGNVVVAELLFLKASARINGDIVTGKLVVESGAVFNGSCIMKAPSDFDQKVSLKVTDGSEEARKQAVLQ